MTKLTNFLRIEEEHLEKIKRFTKRNNIYNKENKKIVIMKKRKYQKNFFISEKFSVIYISKERANFISLLYYIWFFNLIYITILLPKIGNFCSSDHIYDKKMTKLLHYVKIISILYQFFDTLRKFWPYFDIITNLKWHYCKILILLWHYVIIIEKLWVKNGFLSKLRKM